MKKDRYENYGRKGHQQIKAYLILQHLLRNSDDEHAISLTDQGEPIYTIYTSCMDLSTLTYSYVTYDHRAIHSYSMNDLPLDGNRVWYVRMN